MSAIINFFKGIAIGAGAILPGVSSGVLCVIFGIYEKLLDAVLNIFKDFKHNIKFIFPIATGAIIGIIAFGNILKFLFAKYAFQTSYLFIGLILGSLPKLFDTVNKVSKFKLHYVLYLLVALAFGILSVYLESNIELSQFKQTNWIALVLAGFAMSIGVVVPGVSSTIILMLLGVYDIYLTSVANVYLPVLIPICIGLCIGSILFMKITKFLLDNFYAQTFYSIIGFTIRFCFYTLSRGFV